MSALNDYRRSAAAKVALNNYRKSAEAKEEYNAKEVAAQQANLRVRMVHASKIANAGRREVLMAKLMAEFEELGAVVA
jgi:hypothetical protein